MPLTFAVTQRVKRRLFNKGNGVSFIYRWFICDNMEHWIVPWQGHFIFAIFTIWSVPITVVQWPSLGKFVHGLVHVLFMTYHTSRYMNTIVCADQVLFQWVGFSFAHYLWNTWYHYFLCFPWQPQSAKWPQRTDTPLTRYIVLLKARCLQFVSIAQL